MTDLAFGYNDGLVDGLKAKWGARWIVTQDGGVDPVWNRQDSVGEKDRIEKLHEWLNRKSDLWDDEGDEKPVSPFQRATKIASRLLRDYVLRTREERPVILHQDNEGAIVANTNASCGYLYVAAYRYDDLPDGHKTLGLERVLATQVHR